MEYLHLDYDLLENGRKGIDYEKWNREWGKALSKYWKVFDSIQTRFPKTFLNEYNKHQFHDSIIIELLIKNVKLKTKNRYDVHLLLQDDDHTVGHQIVFSDIKNYKSDLEFTGFAGSCDWIYNEFLPVDEKRISLEVLLFSKSTLYFDFSKLQYKKVNF